MGFQQDLNLCSPIEAKLRAIKVGLLISKQLNLPKVMIFSDSLHAINLLSRDTSSEHPLKPLLLEIRDTLYEGWDVSLRYASKEHNVCRFYGQGSLSR